MRVRLMLLTMILSVGLLAAPAAMADIPGRLAWQGVALDSLNQPLTDGSYLFHFAIFSAPTGGDSLWGESQTISVENGVLNVLLGAEVPISDAVFSQPDRFLQVRFENEAPYFPRTQIVSVGYAYRAGTLDGARGGDVKSDLNLKSPFSTPQFRLYREGTGTVIERMSGNGYGGRFDLYSHAGIQTGYWSTSSSTGADFVNFSANPSTGVLMTRTSEGNPVLQIVGLTTGAQFAMDSAIAPDDRVYLPPSSISSLELLNEPGIAQGRVDGIVMVTGNSSMIDVVTVSINIPATGYIVLEAAAQAAIYGTTASNYMAFQIDETAGGGTGTFYYYYVGLSVPPNTGYSYLPVHARRTYYKPSAGTYTFRFEALDATTNGSKYMWNPVLTATYFPTGLGTVVTAASASELPDLGEADAEPLPPALDQDGSPVPPAYRVDLRQLELRAARAETAAREAQLELYKARLAEQAREVEQDR